LHFISHPLRRTRHIITRSPCLPPETVTPPPSSPSSCSGFYVLAVAGAEVVFTV
jgi:hypothetical protein